MLNPFPTNDAWDWPYIIYAGTVILRRTETEVWAMRPRTFKALMDAHADVQNKLYGDKKSNTKTKKPVATRTAAAPGFIDQIPGW